MDASVATHARQEEGNAGDTHADCGSSPCAAATPPPRFRLLADLTDGEADGQWPPFTRCCSAEYLLLVAHCLVVLGGGFLEVASVSKAHIASLATLVSKPWALFRWLGSVGYDNIPDGQYRVYQANLHLFAALAAFTGVGSWWIRRCQAQHPQQSPRSCNSSGGGGRGGAFGFQQVEGEADEKLKKDEPTLTCCRERGKRRARQGGQALSRLVVWLLSQPWSLAAFHAAVGVGFVAATHGPLFILLLGVLTLNFTCVHLLRRLHVPYRLFMLFMWVSLCGSLYLVHACDGFNSTPWAQRLTASLWLARMRWSSAYRMCVLRMIAYDYDMWEACASGPATATAAWARSKHFTSCLECAALREDQQRQETGKALADAGGLVKEGRGGGGATCCEPPLPSGGSLPSSSPTEVLQGRGGGRGWNSGASSHADSPVKVSVHAHPSSQRGPEAERRGTPRHAGDGESSRTADESTYCYKLRTECPRALHEYSYLNYVAYILYTPVYLTGPITSFNAFVSHLQVPTRAMPVKQMFRYALRVFVVWLLLNACMHFVFVNALSSHMKLLKSLTISQQAHVMYNYLAYLWLKFTVMWRLSRLFSLWCGIDVPEDMRRCFSNTFSVRDFWRDWHASFNLWIVRYMYIPMGGRQRIALSIFPIFFFIAIWHDHALHLLKWALCIVAMFAVELLVSALFRLLERAFLREMASVRAEEAVRGESGSNGNNTGTGPRVHDVGLLSPSALQQQHLGNDERGVMSTPPQQGTTAPARGSRRGGVWHAAARAAALRLSRQQRRCAHRMLVTCGATASVFGLICTNLIGYNVQNSFAFNPQDEASHTDKTILQDLREASGLFYVVLLLTMWAPGAMSTVDRQLTAVKLRRAKERFGLSAPPPLPSG